MPSFSPDEMTIRKVSPTRVAAMMHGGEPATIAATVARFIAWRQPNDPSSPDFPIFGIFPTDPRITPPAEFRMQICVGPSGRLHPTMMGWKPH